jgi:hypothetical protein
MLRRRPSTADTCRVTQGYAGRRAPTAFFSFMVKPVVRVRA